MVGLLNTAAALGTALPSPDRALRAVIAAALVLYLEEAGARGQTHGRTMGHAAVAAARGHVRAHVDERITLRHLAAAASVTPTYLVQLFRQEVGTTPVRFLWAERTRQGLYLLEQTGLSVAEVAMRVGFQTPQHFARVIRAATGLSPRAVRRRSWSAATDTSSDQ